MELVGLNVLKWVRRFERSKNSSRSAFDTYLGEFWGRFPALIVSRTPVLHVAERARDGSPHANGSNILRAERQLLDLWP